MADNVMARQQTKWTVISIAPDVCKTPMGSSVPPVPAAREAAYRNAMGATEGTLKTPLTMRQIDILKKEEMYAGQLKTGPVSLTKDNLLAIAKMLNY
ncbi:hypothetical protein QQ994_18135 [Pseudomonas asiatica]|uniref:hypothetical protein n=2 Tax=Pseudomonas TaxID=286 RepID=UPI00256FF399|nr:hypothetical protein [Pseudomonas asiatica]WJD68534.1 hypothetical protein QQ994_18135 [Pseudomonas asiatica]